MGQPHNAFDENLLKIEGNPGEFMKSTVALGDFYRKGKTEEAYKLWKQEGWSFSLGPTGGIRKARTYDTWTNKDKGIILKSFMRYVFGSAHNMYTMQQQIMNDEKEIKILYDIANKYENFLDECNKTITSQEGNLIRLDEAIKDNNPKLYAKLITSAITKTSALKKLVESITLLDPRFKVRGNNPEQSITEHIQFLMDLGPDDTMHANFLLIEKLNEALKLNLDISSSDHDIQEALEEFKRNLQKKENPNLKQYQADIFKTCFSGNICDWPTWELSFLSWINANGEMICPTDGQKRSLLLSLLSGNYHQIALTLSSFEEIMEMLRRHNKDPQKEERDRKLFSNLKCSQNETFLTFFTRYTALRSIIQPTSERSREVLLDGITKDLQNKLKTHMVGKNPGLDLLSLNEIVDILTTLDNICPPRFCNENNCKIPNDSYRCCEKDNCKGQKAPSPTCLCPSEWIDDKGKRRHRKACQHYEPPTKRINQISYQQQPFYPENESYTSTKTYQTVNTINIDAIQQYIRRVRGDQCQNHTTFIPSPAFRFVIDHLTKAKAIDPTNSVRIGFCSTRGLCPDCLHPIPGNQLYNQFIQGFLPNPPNQQNPH